MLVAAPRLHAMKKVVCPACGLVNLEKFVTYPHCAACGAPLAGAPDERVPLWKIPLSAPLWATILGVCCAILGLAGLFVTRETRPPTENLLVVYAQAPRRLNVGQTGQIQLVLDSIEGEGAPGEINDLQLRVPRSMLRDFVVSISPLPQSQIQRRNGIYFDFGDVRRGQTLVVSLSPRRSGATRLGFTIYARDFPLLQWSGSLKVAPGPPRNAPRAMRRATRQTGP